MTRRRPRLHLRLIENPVVDPTDEAPGVISGSYAETVTQGVVANLIRDADQVTDAAVYAVADAIVGHGFELYPERAVELRQTIFDMIAGALRARLLAGLSDTNIDGVSGDRPRVAGGTRGIDDEDFLPRTDTPQGLMERFRAALAEDGEQQS